MLSGVKDSARQTKALHISSQKWAYSNKAVSQKQFLSK